MSARVRTPDRILNMVLYVVRIFLLPYMPAETSAPVAHRDSGWQQEPVAMPADRADVARTIAGAFGGF